MKQNKALKINISRVAFKKHVIALDRIVNRKCFRTDQETGTKKNISNKKKPHRNTHQRNRSKRNQFWAEKSICI